MRTSKMYIQVISPKSNVGQIWDFTLRKSKIIHKKSTNLPSKTYFALTFQK